jgi:hypothetical protein
MDQTAMGLPTHSLVILVKCGRLGGISEIPLLPLRGKRERYVCNSGIKSEKHVKLSTNRTFRASTRGTFLLFITTLFNHHLIVPITHVFHFLPRCDKHSAHYFTTGILLDVNPLWKCCRRNIFHLSEYWSKWNNHHHQLINVPITGAQTLWNIRKTGHSPPRKPKWISGSQRL